MTVSSSTNKFRYEGNGSTDTFAFTGRIFSASDLKVEIITRATDALVETLTLTTDYTVTINGPESASVQITNALKIPSSLQDVQLRRDLAQTQTVDLPTGTVFPASSVENALDKMAALVQDLSEEVDRCVKISVTSSDDPPDALEVIDAADDAADSAAAAAASAAAAAASAAGVDLPALGAANTVLKVNSGGTAAEYGKIAAANITDGTITPTQAAIASQAEAEAGSINTKFMTPQRTAQAIAALAAGGLANNGYATNRYYSGFGWGPVTGTKPVADNRLYYKPFIVGASETFTRIGINVTSFAAGNARLGIYNFANGVPTTRVLDAGTVSTGTNGAKEVTISQLLATGVYVLVIVCDATPTLSSHTSADSSFLADLVGMDSGLGQIVSGYAAFTYGALPSSFPAITSQNENVADTPASWLRKV